MFNNTGLLLIIIRPAVTPDPQVIGPLILSCLVGVCMSHAAYMLRDAVSATLFTIVGILCKVTMGTNSGWCGQIVAGRLYKGRHLAPKPEADPDSLLLSLSLAASEV